MAKFTKKQGQYLAFIHLYRKLNRQRPAELDVAKYFRVSPPSVHQMIVKLDELGLVTREPGGARSMRVDIPAREIPDLEEEAD
jgi:repressor LexA